MNQLFLALEIEANTQIISELKKYKTILSQHQLSWVIPSKMHLTLYYFGDIAGIKIPQLVRVIQNHISEIKIRELDINKIGVFGSKYQPKVIWWGIKREEDLKLQFEKLFNDLEINGFKKDNQNFVPHITLAKVGGKLQNKAFWDNFELIKPKETVFSLNFKEIKLLNGGKTHNSATNYQVIESFKFF